MSALAPEQGRDGRPRGWPRAGALFGVTLVLSIVEPAVLVGAPLVVLAVGLGTRRPALIVLVFLAVLVCLGGVRDGLWYGERGWALLAGGLFTALTLRRPGAGFTARALWSVVGAAALAGLILSQRADGWATLDWSVQDRLLGGVGTALEAFRLLRGGEALPPALVTTVYQTVEAQAQVFPAMLGLATVAGLGVAWWVWVRFSAGSDQGLGPLRDFRFNDHLVWVFIAGLALMAVRSGEGLGRVGSNVVVFMGALYAMRGAAVTLFLSGGMTLLSYVLLGFGLVFVPPLVLSVALLIGLGDTWLDMRAKAGAAA